VEPAQAAFIADVFWWTGMSIIVGLLVRIFDPDEAS
jgi:hypothetical protein